MHDRMQEFLDILRGTNKAETTVNQYRKGLVTYSDWLKEQELDIYEVETRDIQRYLAYLKSEKGYAHNTIRLKFASVSQFYQDVVDNQELEDDPTEKVQLAEYAPKVTRKEEETKEKRVWLRKDELKALVENVPAPSVRNRLVVLMQYYTALRRQELSDIKLTDIDRENREVKVRGKRGKINTAHWQPRLDGLLSAWLDMGHRESSPYARESEYLFVTESSPKLSGSRINDIVKEAAENAGIQEVLYTDAAGKRQFKVTSHTLRHSFAMHFLDNGGSIDELSKLLAHSSVTTTEIYGEISDKRAKEGYEKHAPHIEF